MFYLPVLWDFVGAGYALVTNCCNSGVSNIFLMGSNSLFI